MTSSQEAHQPNNQQSPSNTTSQSEFSFVQELPAIRNNQDFFCFLKSEEKPSPSFFSEKGLSQDIIQVTEAEPDIALEVFYALYHTLRPQIEKQSSTSLKDAWTNFIGGLTSKGIPWSPENLMDDPYEVKENFQKNEDEKQIFLHLDEVVGSIINLKTKLADCPGEILQRREIMASLKLVGEFYTGFRKKVKDLLTTIFQNQDPLTNYHALESLLEPKALMMGDIFAHHWAYRIPRKKAKKLLSLNKWKDHLKNYSNEGASHRVAALPEKHEAPQPLVYFKANGRTPIQPEKEFMLYSLYRHLQIPVPETALLILTDVFAEDLDYYYAVQASEAVIGESAFEACQNQETIFEQGAFASQVIGALLTNPSDGSFKNFTYSSNFQTLIGIDNDLVFEPEFTEGRGKTINVKSVLYLLSQMDLTIPEATKTFFTTLDPYLTTLSWLNDLSKKNKQYALLFSRLTFQKTRCIYQRLLHQNQLIPLATCIAEKVSVDPDLHSDLFYPQILVSKTLLSNVTEKLQIIETTLENDRLRSPQILFENLSPILGKYYRKLRLGSISPEEALDVLWDHQKNSSSLGSLLSHEELGNLSHKKTLLNKDLIPEMFFKEYKKKLVSKKIPPLDKFIQCHSQRKRKNLFNLHQALEELHLLVQEGLTDSRSPQDIVDFWYRIFKLNDIDHHLKTKITSLLFNLPNAQSKWLFTIEKYFLRSDCYFPDELRPSSLVVTDALMRQRTFVLMESAKQYIFDEQGNIKKNANLTGRSSVTCFPERNPEFYLKQYPEFPGYEFASLLFMSMIGITHLPYQELILNKNSEYPVLLSQAIDGDPVFQVWQDPKAFSNLDPFHTGLLIIAAILLNPEDGKEDNFILSPDGKYIIPIDNDHYFLPSTFQKQGSIWSGWTVNTALQTKTLLFCLDEMKKPIPNKVRQRLLSINFDSLLTSWMTEVIKVDDQYHHLVGENQRDAFLKNGTVLRIPFYEQFIHHLYWKVDKIQDLLKGSIELTPFCLLKAVEPFATRCYQDSFKHGSTLQDRFKAATSQLYSNSKTLSGGSRMSILNTQSILNIINISEADLHNDETFNKIWPSDALEVLEQLIREKREKRKKEQSLLCKLDDPNEESFWTILFGNPLLEKNLKDFFTNPKEGLALKGSKLITSSYLTYYFAQTPDQGAKIKFLSLPNSPLLDNKAIRALAEGCPNLEYLNVSGCVKLEEIVTMKGEWSLLTRLEAKDCLNLKKFVSVSPIRLLRIETSRQMEIFVEKLTFDTLLISNLTYGVKFSLTKGEEFEFKLLQKTISNNNFFLIEEDEMEKEIGFMKIAIGLQSIIFTSDLAVFLTVIDLRESHLKIKDIQRVIMSKLINLKRLDLSRNKLKGTDYLKHLIQRDWPKLTYLNLSGNEIHDEGLKILTRGNWPLLEVLNLRETKITAVGVEIIFSEAKWPQLKNLDISENEINDQVLAAICQGDWALLETLNLGNISFTKKTLLKLLLNPNWLNLKEININKDEDNFAKSLLQNNWPFLEELDLSYSKITKSEIKTIVKRSKWPGLKHLNISNNEIFDEGVSILTQAEWPLLEELNVKNTKITQKGLEDLVHQMKLQNLKKLDISENIILDEGLKILASGKWPLFEHLVYYNTQVTMKGHMSLLESMRWPNLSHLEHSLCESFCNYDESKDQWSPSKNILVTIPMCYKEQSLLVTVINMTWFKSKEIYLTINHQDVSTKIIILPENKLDQLESINISLNALPKMRSLQSIILPFHVKMLDLSNNSLSDKNKLEDLLMTKCLQLESLCLSKTSITSQSLEILANKSDWPNLKRLDLSHNTIQNDGLKVLSSIKWPLLEDLNFGEMQINAEGLEILVSQSNWPNLKILDLSSNKNIFDEEIKSLALGKWPLLECLYLKWTNITLKDIEALVHQSAWKNLKEIHFLGLTRSDEVDPIKLLILERWPDIKTDYMRSI